jgi:(R,R)-butanediol dehydrogenase/meso-butanediol dehydrogenase/diacetyl reductase
MRAAVFSQVGHPFEITTVDDPTPAPGDMILAVKGAGICGSDLHVTELGLASGAVMGHEFAGEVVEVGKDVSEFKAGDRVTALPAISCGRCRECLNGYLVRCSQLRRVGFDVGGAFAEFVRVRANAAMKLPAGLNANDAALVEPLAVGLHAVVDAGMPAGANLYIAGGGPVGLAVALWAGVFGARNVVVGDPVASRRSLAEDVGASGTLDPTKGDLAENFAAQVGSPPDMIFECVGRPGVMSALFELAPPGSKVVGAGVCMQPDTFVPVVPNAKELTLQWVSDYRRQDFELVLDMLDAGRVEPLSLVTDRVSLAAFPDAFEALRKPTTQCKVLLDPSS